jgi:tRNA (guanine-N7-)-methyltransferase
VSDTVRTYKTRRRTTATQADALARLLLSVPPGPLDAVALFGRVAPLVLEVGSGTGEAAVAMAAAEPDRDLLCVEVHTPGLGTLLRAVEAEGLTNVRVLEGDAREVLRSLLQPDSLDEVRVFFPDPWPKARHAKRRLVGPAFLSLVADRLRPGGRLHVATDDAPYFARVRSALAEHDRFDVLSYDRGLRPVTRYERRGLAAGRPAQDVVAVRR